MTKTPEQWLEEAAPEKKGGTLKLFLGYAPGVGKTYNMLSEAIRRHSRGEDVAIGVIETHGRKPITELASRLDSIPRRKIEYKGTIFEEMDVDAILARKPAVVLIDELAHTNIEGSKHPKRYQDVMDILDANIDVLSTLNVQHIESLNDVVAQITGVRVVRAFIRVRSERARFEVANADLTQTSLRVNRIFALAFPALLGIMNLSTVAILFILFDIELFFLWLWAMLFRRLGWFGFVEMLVFLLILGVGYAYIWKKGAFDL